MIPYLRIYELSIINYLKYEIMPLSFLEQETNVPLVLDNSLGGYVANTSMIPDPTSTGRGWAFFDETTVNGNLVIDTTAEQSSRVAVVGASSYTIDYANGVIKNPNTTPSSVSYYWNYVSFIAGWPGIVPPPLPVVAVDIDTSDRNPFQLGGGSRDILDCSIYVFATNEVEKRDITSVLHDAIYSRSLSVKNWHEGSYLNYDGTFNSGFSPSVVSGVGQGYFQDVVSDLAGPRMDWSEVNRHRSKITFKFEVFRD